MQTKSSISLGHLYLAVLISAVWGASFVVSKQGLTLFPPFLFAALRFLLCAIPFVFFVPRPASFASIFWVGASFTIQFAFLFLGMKLGAKAGLSSLVMQSQVLVTALLSVLFFGERLRALQWAGIFVSSLGILSLVFQQNHKGQALGYVMVLIGSLGWACANVLIRKSGAKNALHLMIWVSLIPPLPLLALSFLFENPLRYVSISSIQSSAGLAVLYVAYGATLLGYSLWGILLRNYPASVVAPFSMLVPVFGMGFACLLSGEALTLPLIGSALLILGGVCLVIFRFSAPAQTKMNATNK